jgi:hypothetical protein
MKMLDPKVLLIIDLQTGFAPVALAKQIQAEILDYPLVLQTRFVHGNPLFKSRLGWDEDPGELWLPEIQTFDKQGYGLPASLIQTLHDREVKTVDLCGCELEACVLAAAFNLWDAKILPKLRKGLIKCNDLANPTWPLIAHQFGADE